MRSRWRTVATVLAVVVVMALGWRACQSTDKSPPAAAVDFSYEKAVLVSPDLDLELVEVRGIAHPTFTDWACLFECRESGGCRADVRVRVEYSSDGEGQTLNLSGRLNADHGEIMRVGRVQRPATAVDQIERVTVEVAAILTPDAPVPTPVQ